MNVTLKPFDFAQAAARAGLSPNGQPLKAAGGVDGGGFQAALTPDDGGHAEGADRLPGHADGPKPLGFGLQRDHEHAGLSGAQACLSSFSPRMGTLP